MKSLRKVFVVGIAVMAIGCAGFDLNHLCGRISVYDDCARSCIACLSEFESSEFSLDSVLCIVRCSECAISMGVELSELAEYLHESEHGVEGLTCPISPDLPE